MQTDYLLLERDGFITSKIAINKKMKYIILTRGYVVYLQKTPLSNNF